MATSNSFDFVVVGGGIFGAGAAWELARRGASVVLLEADRLASGASGGPGQRGVRANSRDARELALSRLANEIWPGLADELATPTGYERIGGLELFETQASLDRAHRQVVAQARHGIRTLLLDRAEVRRLEPSLSDAIAGAVYCPDDGVADHTATTLAFAQAAAREGATILEGSNVVRLEPTPGRARIAAVVDSHGERFEIARELVTLVNAATPALLAPLGIGVPIARVFPQALLLDGLPELTIAHLVGHLERRAIVKRLPARELMITGGWLGRWDDEHHRGEAVDDRVAANLAEAAAIVPALGRARVQAAFADRAESVGPELLPIIDRVPGFENVVVGAGWSGHGFAIAPAVCRLLAEWLLGAAKPAPLEPFRWRA